MLSSYAKSSRSRRPSVWVTWICVAAHLGVLAHFGLVEHERCAEHGELVHGEAHGASSRVEETAANVSDEPLPPTQAALRRGVSARGENHDHCLVATERRILRPAEPQLRVAPRIPERSTSGHGGVVTPTGEALYRRAPKTSPPVGPARIS